MPRREPKRRCLGRNCEKWCDPNEKWCSPACEFETTLELRDVEAARTADAVYRVTQGLKCRMNPPRPLYWFHRV